MIVSLLGTLITYLLSIILFESILDVYYIYEWIIILKILSLAIASWLPFYIASFIKNKCYPDDTDKLNDYN
jgi:hypothetical protein